MTDKTDDLADAAQDLLSAVERDWPNYAAWRVKTLMLAGRLRAELVAHKADTMSTQTDRAMVERLAREAGFTMHGNLAIVPPSRYTTDITGELERFAALVAAECAQMCENTGPDDTTGENCAAAIRERFGITEG